MVKQNIIIFIHAFVFSCIYKLIKWENTNLKIDN